MYDRRRQEGRPAFRASFSAGHAAHRLAALRKDIGPNGGTPPTAVQPNAFEPEDEYQQLYVGATRDQGVIQPPYNLRQLDALSQENNTLGPCIEVMVTNIDGTGYDFVSEDTDEDDAEDDPKVDALEEFFAQPWPDMSFKEMRRILRRDRERTGNAYIEVLRNAQDEIVMFRRVDAKMMRMLRLDDAIPVDVTVIRDGKKQTVKVMTRERRYCQLVNGVTLMYFKEFGSTRDLHKKTAVWAPQGQRLPAEHARHGDHALHRDPGRPYALRHPALGEPNPVRPRLPQGRGVQHGLLRQRRHPARHDHPAGRHAAGPDPSGARGDELGRGQEEQPHAGAGGRAGRRLPAADPAGEGDCRAVRRGSPAGLMFEKYDERCEERVRRSFRIPPIFLGSSKDYNFATAFASYTVAEAQVFKPERDEFDEIISMKLLTAMGYDGYKLRSKPLVIEDATLKLQGLEVIQAMGDQVEPSDLVKAVNDITGTTLKVSDDAPTLGDKIAQQKQQQLVANQTALMGAQAGAAAGGMARSRRSTRLRSPRPASRCPVRRRRPAATPARSSPNPSRTSWAATASRSLPSRKDASLAKTSSRDETFITSRSSPCAP